MACFSYMCLSVCKASLWPVLAICVCKASLWAVLAVCVCLFARLACMLF